MPSSTPETSKRIFTVPNALSCFRLFLLPLIVVLYWNAKTGSDYFLAGLVMGISSLTDMLDGKLARKLGQISELGIFLDPLADKLTLCVVVFVVALRTILNGTGGMSIGILAGLLAAKDIFMAVGCGVVFHHNHRRFHGSLMVGKVCTAYLYVVAFLFVLAPGFTDETGTLLLTPGVQNILVLVGIVLMGATWVAYLRQFRQLWLLPPETVCE